MKVTALNGLIHGKLPNGILPSDKGAVHMMSATNLRRYSMKEMHELAGWILHTKIGKDYYPYLLARLDITMADAERDGMSDHWHAASFLKDRLNGVPLPENSPSVENSSDQDSPQTD